MKNIFSSQLCIMRSNWESHFQENSNLPGVFEFVVHNTSQARQHQSLELGSNLKYLNIVSPKNSIITSKFC